MKRYRKAVVAGIWGAFQVANGFVMSGAAQHWLTVVAAILGTVNVLGISNARPPAVGPAGPVDPGRYPPYLGPAGGKVGS